MDFMDDSLLGSYHEFVDFQELLPKSPALRTDPNTTATNVELARLLTIVYLKTNPSHR